MKKSVLITIFLCTPALLLATRYHVKTAVSGDSTGSSWANATLLNRALDSAGVGDTVWVWSGTYTIESLTPGSGCAPFPFTLGSGVRLFGSFNSTTETDSTRGYATYSVISGDINSNNAVDQDEYNTLLQVLPTTTDQSTISGFRFKHGMTAIDASDANLFVDTCRFRKFTGWAGVLEDHGATIEFLDCDFFDNTPSGHGAIIHSRSSELTFTNCIFWDNIKDGYRRFGGGILHSDTTEVTFVNCAFDNNTTSNETDFPKNPTGSDLTLINCTFYDNVLGTTSSINEVLDTVYIINSILRYDDVLEHAVSLTGSGVFNLDYSAVPVGYTGPGYTNAGITFSDPNINTNTLRLKAASTNAFDKGLDSAHPNISGKDRDGEERRQDKGQCDIDLGAFERSGTSCSSKSDDEGISKDEVTSHAIGIFPNPTQGEFTVKTENSITAITIRDLAGRVISTYEYNVENNYAVNLNLMRQPAGYYFIEVTMGSEISLEKLILQ